MRWPRPALLVLCVLQAAALVRPNVGSGQLPERTFAAPSYSRTVFGTVGGGLTGALLVGGTLGLLGEATGDGDDFISPGALGLVYGGAIGYWLGQAVGASWGSATDVHRIPARQLLWPAALWTGAGLAAYALIGDGFDPEDAEGSDLTSWYVGAAVGGALQIVGMSVTTYRRAANASAEPPRVSLRVYPSADHQRRPTLHLTIPTSF